MLVHGTCNPAGMEEGYVGVYLSEKDICDVVKSRDLEGKPVFMEHRGQKVGQVVSAWQFNGKLDVLVNIADDDFTSRVAGTYVAAGCLRDFSLGYNVKASKSGIHAEKKMLEVSLVKKGARDDCHIKNYVCG